MEEPKFHTKIDFSTFMLIAAALLAAAHVLVVVFVRDPDVLMLASNVFNPATAVLAAVLMLLASASLFKVSRRRSLVWGLLGLAQMFSAAGDISWSVFEMILLEPPTPSIADVFYLLFYGVFLAGVMLIPLKQTHWSHWFRGTIDVWIVLLTAFLALWVYLLGPLMAANADQPILYQVVLIIYPLGDILLLWAQLIVLFGAVGYPVRNSLWLVVAGLTLFIFTDITYAYLSLLGTYQSGSWPDTGYSLAYVLLGLAGYYEHHLLKGRQPVSARPFSDPPMWVLTLPYAWVVFSYFILVYGMYVELPLSRGRVAAIVSVITGLVLLRQILSMYDNARLSANLAGVLAQVKQQASNLERTNRQMHGEIVERRQTAARLSYDAMHDGLTGLANRALFLDRLQHAAKKKHRQPSVEYSVMFLDLDGFKLVNDSLGHSLGDKLLVRVAYILNSCVRANDTVARLSGDEFVILVENTADSQNVLEMANRLQAELHQPINLEGTLVYITASIGIVLDVQENERPEDLLCDADLAMYRAKAQGKARYVIFHSGMRDTAVSRQALETDLRRALTSSAFYLEYQPTFHLASGQVVGFEALLRWQHPERGRVDPKVFLPVAEDSGLILEMGKWCLDEACRQAMEWQTCFASLGPLKLGVNISARQLKDPTLVRQVSDALAVSGLPGHCLVLEVTESACLESLDALREALEELRGLGVAIQIDDFGTGYSAFSYLQSLPVQAVKIDRSFIHPIGKHGDQRAIDILRAILAMASSLAIEATAEGIETDAQLAVLKQQGCLLGQGYHLAYPMERAELDAWLRNRTAAA